MDKLSPVKLERDHYHGGKLYPAGDPIMVSEKRREFFKIRGMIQTPAKGKGKES